MSLLWQLSIRRRSFDCRMLTRHLNTVSTASVTCSFGGCFLLGLIYHKLHLMYHLKKSLGQHFLKDQHIIDKILESLNQLEFSHLLEVGPGGGALTGRLLKMPFVEFRAVEIDDEKVQYLISKFHDLKLIHEDFLKMKIPFTEPFTIIGNFPYNISSQIVFRTIDWFPQVQHVVGMFQKEVAERITAKPGGKDYGVLTVLTQYYYDATYLFTVGKNSFVPPPKVESAVIKMEVRKELLPVKSESTFKKLVKASFAQRRKTLRNNLKGMIASEKLSDTLFDRRAETLSVAEFAKLSFWVG